MQKDTKNKFLIHIVRPTVIFFGLILITTYPLVLKIKTCMPGFFSTDESFIIVWNAWRIKFAFLNHLSMVNTDYIAYPFGIAIYSNHLVSYVWFFINHALALLTTPVMTYNLQVILCIFLSAFFTYLLVYRLTKNYRIAIFSGIIFGFCPYIFVRSWQHLGEMYVWPMPLLLWSLLRLKESLRLVNKSLYVLSLVLAAINYAVMYYCILILFIFFICLVFKWRQNKKYITNILFLSAVAAIFLLPQFWSVFENIFAPQQRASSAWNVYKRPFDDIFMQSAKPLSYILPPVAHPIFGKFTEQFVGGDLYGASFTEHTLYLGFLPLILAFLAFRKRKMLTEDSDRFYFNFFFLLAVGAWLFSQPPWWQIGPVKLYMPSFFMHKILPMFRAYCRFGVVLMFAVAVLAGFGLKYAIGRLRTQIAKTLATVLFCAIVLFEFWTWPPYKVINVIDCPAVYSWLKEQPKEIIIAEYPLDAYSPNEMYKLYQVKHEKKMINGTLPETRANKFAQGLVKLSDPRTAGILRSMKVKYVLVHVDGYLNTELKEDADELKKIPSSSGLKLVKSFPAQECTNDKIMCIYNKGAIDLYEVVAEPSGPLLNQ
ncbi:MAG: hypothetical protein NTZ92_06160 [Candidatus Omnitrophica bacterium]|nr:hypothetical protein [Candidatus Omnitrophota bacterium]